LRRTRRRRPSPTPPSPSPAPSCSRPGRRRTSRRCASRSSPASSISSP
jgi:hypothetical protein